MPRIEAVWGIDIGNCSLKALRLRPGPERDQVIADAFDYIEYPQILTQPGAEQPAQLVADALQQFLSRNDLRGTSVAVSVSGQNGLARFIKLPPVETRKIPDIVNYEAHQQIPFDLNDVIWDYQRMGGGLEEEGFVLEAEIGLFAMKRDQVLRALEPFDHAGISVDYVQLAPLALFNFLVFDQLTDLPSADEYDSENPPPSTVILSMGTDASDLVVTNGFRVWQRSIPIGGNHFTKALVKEMKLTFAKAEHLKRNASSAPDPKAVFQAMRQVFNELLTEVQRSIGYFTTLDRSAKIQRVLAVGNCMKLPGLRRFLAQGLGFEVEVLESFREIAGSEVVGDPAFQANHLCFPICFGLSLQGLSRTSLRTNLIPKEIVQDRIIRGKKPWAVAAAAVLLLGCLLSFASYSRALDTVAPSRFEDAEKRAGSVTAEAKDFRSKADDAKAQMDKTDDIGKKLVQNVEGRFRWLELLRAVNSALPRDPDGKMPEDPELRQQLHIRSLDCQPLENLENWVSQMKQSGWLASDDGSAAAGGSGEGSGASPDAGTPSPAPASEGGESGQAAEPVGWLITLQGHHYHNNREASGDNMIGAQYLRNTLMNKLRSGDVILPGGTGEEKERATMKELGIINPVLINPGRIYEESIVDPNAVLALEASRATKGGTTGGGAGAMAGAGAMPGAAGGMAAGAAKRGAGGSMPGMGAMQGMGGMGGMGAMGGAMGKGGAMPGAGRSAAGGRTTTKSAGSGGGTATAAGDDSETTIKVRKFDFTVQFVWQPTTPSERKKKRAASAEQAAASGLQAPEGQQPAAAQPAAPGQAPPAANSGAAAPAGAPPAATPPAGAPPAAAPAAPGATQPPAAQPQPVPGAPPTAKSGEPPAAESK